MLQELLQQLDTGTSRCNDLGGKFTHDVHTCKSRGLVYVSLNTNEMRLLRIRHVQAIQASIL